jgi:hypothetical protein
VTYRFLNRRSRAENRCRTLHSPSATDAHQLRDALTSTDASTCTRVTHGARNRCSGELRARDGLESDTALSYRTQQVPSDLHEQHPALVAQGIEHRFPNFLSRLLPVQVAALSSWSETVSADRQ